MGYARKTIVEALDEVYEETAYELLGEQQEKGYADLFVLRNDTVVPFITSFCEKGDQLSQWRGYAGSGHGYRSASSFARHQEWPVHVGRPC
jgi:hypothetical protein